MIHHLNLSFVSRNVGIGLVVAAVAALTSVAGCSNEHHELNTKVEFGNQVVDVEIKLRKAVGGAGVHLADLDKALKEDPVRAKQIPEEARAKHQALVEQFAAIKAEASAIKVPPGKEAEKLNVALRTYLENCEAIIRKDHQEYVDNLTWSTNEIPFKGPLRRSISDNHSDIGNRIDRLLNENSKRLKEALDSYRKASGI